MTTQTLGLREVAEGWTELPATEAREKVSALAACETKDEQEVDRVSEKRRWRRVVEYEEIPESEFLMAKVWAALGLPEPSRSGPCWCNRGPGRDETHHSFCRKRRARWRASLRALKKIGKFEEEIG